MLQKFLRKLRGYRMSMRTKLTLGLGSIAAMLLLSSVISVLEYRRMSNYVSDLVAENIRNINVAQKLVSMCDEYNLKVLAAIGEEHQVTSVPDFDRDAFMALCDGLRTSIASEEAFPLADSVVYAYSAYISNAAYMDLQTNSMTFQDSFYRSIIPGIVSVGAGLVLVLLLLFFILAYYVNPVYRMLSALQNYTLTGSRYRCSFEGNDQLAALNDGIADVVEENVELRRRTKALRDEREKLIEMVQSVQE